METLERSNIYIILLYDIFTISRGGAERSICGFLIHVLLRTSSWLQLMSAKLMFIYLIENIIKHVDFFLLY